MTGLTPDSLSRIDKFLMDSNGVNPEQSRRRRAEHGMDIIVGEDVSSSYGLQVALLTAVNLAVKCFGRAVRVYGSDGTWAARALTSLSLGGTLGEAANALGAQCLPSTNTVPATGHLILGDVVGNERAVRMTFDGWQVAVGPAAQVNRMRERLYCSLASIAAAAIGVGEIFADFSGITLTATRRPIFLSLWRPDFRNASDETAGVPLQELPLSLGVFGLGHLGQAYLWGIAALLNTSPVETSILLCDDDVIVDANVETGALLDENSPKNPKTREAARWLERRGFKTKLLERWVDENFRRTDKEPAIALSAFDNNAPRRWLATAGFQRVFDSGLGGEHHNFDSIAFHAWPNARPPYELWPDQTTEEKAARDARTHQQSHLNPAYGATGEDECGRLRLAERSVAVPFVGALAGCLVLAEMLKSINGGPVFGDIRVRLCSLGNTPPLARLASAVAMPMRGVSTQVVRHEATPGA